MWVRWLALGLRAFAFGWIVLVGAAIFYAPQLAAHLGPTSWLALLMPQDAERASVWCAIAALNAGSAFYLAAQLEEEAS